MESNKIRVERKDKEEDDSDYEGLPDLVENNTSPIINRRNFKINSEDEEEEFILTQNDLIEEKEDEYQMDDKDDEEEEHKCVLCSIFSENLDDEDFLIMLQEINNFFYMEHMKYFDLDEKNYYEITQFLTLAIYWIENRVNNESLSNEDVYKTIYILSNKLWFFLFHNRQYLSIERRKHIWITIIHCDYYKNMKSIDKTLCSKDLNCFDKKSIIAHIAKDIPIVNYCLQNFFRILNALPVFLHNHGYSKDLRIYFNHLYHRCCSFTLKTEQDNKTFNHVNFTKVEFCDANENEELVNNNSYTRKKEYFINDEFLEVTEIFFFEFYSNIIAFERLDFDIETQNTPFSCNKELLDTFLSIIKIRIENENLRRIINQLFRKQIYDVNLILGEKEEYMRNTNGSTAILNPPSSLIIAKYRQFFNDIILRNIRKASEDKTKEDYYTALIRERRIDINLNPICINYELLFTIVIDIYLKSKVDNFDIKNFVIEIEPSTNFEILNNRKIPLIIKIFKQYHVLFKGIAYYCYSIESAFLLWFIKSFTYKRELIEWGKDPFFNEHVWYDLDFENLLSEDFNEVYCEVISNMKYAIIKKSKKSISEKKIYNF
jgi:hypothetical protein